MQMSLPTTSTPSRRAKTKSSNPALVCRSWFRPPVSQAPALKLEGAGFTVYRISKLSKAAQFKQNPDGSYDAASILSAYRKDNYDNATLKYDFTAEGQAIANMFEERYRHGQCL